MTSFEKRRLIQMVTLGGVLTFAVLAVHLLGLLAPMDRWLYHWRARHFQYFAPPPTEQLVHLDIDDAALDEVGAWPWPRAYLARVIDEVRLAGGRALAMDLLFPEPQSRRFEVNPDGTAGGLIDDDAELAAAVERFGAVLIPPSLSLMRLEAPTPLERRARELLREDLSMTDEAFRARLEGSALVGEAGAGHLNDVFARARRAAVADRIAELIDGTPHDEDPPSVERVRAALVGEGGDGRITGIHRLIDQEHRRLEAIHELRRFTKPAGMAREPLLRAHEHQPPILPLARAAGATGLVDYVRFRDGVVRELPLWVEHRGRLYPHLSLAFACLTWGLDVRDVRIEVDRLVIPRLDGGSIVVPTRRQRIGATGDSYGGFFDVPWYGPPEAWEYMYDYPDYREPRQHVPLSAVIGVLQTQDRIESNNFIADDAIKYFLSIYFAPERLEAYERDPPPLDDPAGRDGVMREILEDPFLAGNVELLADAEELDAEEERLLHNHRRVRAALEENARLADLLERRRGELRGLLEGRSVLLGWIATAAMADFVPTSIHSEAPGVVVHGAIFNALMTENFWRPAPGWLAPMITVLLGLMATVVASGMAPLQGTVATVLIVAGWLLLNGLVLFDYGNVIADLAPPLLAVALVWPACIVSRFVAERLERARIEKRFRSYVDPALVDYVKNHPEHSQLDGQVRELTVVFTDLAGFTTLSERLGAQSVSLLNEYMGIMVPLIREYNGYVNKFLGDGIMFFYGAPRANAYHAADAVSTVLKMQRAMAPFNEKLTERGLPNVYMRAGVASGQMVVGDAGPPDASDYTVLGDTVNLAARLESANKAVGTLTMLSGPTVDLLDGLFLVRPIGRLQVVGKSEGVMTYEPLCYTDDVTDNQRRLVELTRAMVDAYIAGEFYPSIMAADELEGAFGPSKLAEMYRASCRHNLVERPDDFAGQIVLTAK